MTADRCPRCHTRRQPCDDCRTASEITTITRRALHTLTLHQHKQAA